MIDVVFIILIAFILIAPILSVDHVLLCPSSSRHSTSRTTAPIQITIRRDGSLWIQGHATSLENLRQELQQIPLHQTPQIAPDLNAPFGSYQAVKQLIEEIGFNDMEVLLSPAS